MKPSLPKTAQPKMKLSISTSLCLAVLCVCIFQCEARSTILFGEGELGHSLNSTLEECPWQIHCERICYRRGCEPQPLSRPCDEMTGTSGCFCSCRYTGESDSESTDDSSHADSSSEDSDL